jgi:hypothetical protein
MMSLSSEMVANSRLKMGLILVQVFCAGISSKWRAVNASHFFCFSTNTEPGSDVIPVIGDLAFVHSGDEIHG